MGATLVLGACQDASQPEQSNIPTAPVEAAPAPSAAMTALGANFSDATVPFLSTIEDQKAQLALRSTLNSLSEDLSAGKTDAATSDIKQARALLAKLEGRSAAVETAPIALALDNIELTLKGELPGGAPTE
jgi:hypothetical protein